MNNLPKGLQNGLVLWLNEQGKDISGNGNNGTLVNTPTVVRRSQQKGLSYNGSSQYANIPLTGTTTVSVSIWAKKISGSNFVLIRKDTVGTRHLYGMYNGTGDELKIGMYNGTFYDVTTTLAPSEGWCHFVMTISGSSGVLKAYKNGQQVGADTNLGVFTAPSTDWYLGRDVTGAAAYFNGQVINPMIWNRVLSATEIQQLYYGTFIK